MTRIIQPLSSRLLLGFFLFFAAGVATLHAKDDKAVPDGMVKADWGEVDALYRVEGTSLNGYQKIAIADATVEMRDNWLRQQNRYRPSPTDRIRPEDVEKIQQELAEDLDQHFTKALEAAGYQVVDSAGEGVLLLNPALVNVEIFDPNLSYRQSSRSVSPVSPQLNSGQIAGQMTLQLEFVDGGNSEAMALVEDRLQSRKVTSNFGKDITDRAANAATFDRWAKKLIDLLNSPAG